MLVLRRRPGEAILFGGGLRVSLLELAGHQAWLGLSGPGVAGEVALSVLASSSAGRAEIAVRRPLRVTGQGGLVEIVLDPEAGPDCTLVVARRPGESVAVGGLLLGVEAADDDRAVLSVAVDGLPGPVKLSVFSASGAEAKIGIDAPREVQVFREEVWRDLAAENSAAAGRWSPDELERLPGLGGARPAGGPGAQPPEGAEEGEGRALPASRGTATP